MEENTTYIFNSATLAQRDKEQYLWIKRYLKETAKELFASGKYHYNKEFREFYVDLIEGLDEKCYEDNN